MTSFELLQQLRTFQPFIFYLQTYTISSVNDPDLKHIFTHKNPYQVIHLQRICQNLSTINNFSGVLTQHKIKIPMPVHFFIFMAQMVLKIEADQREIEQVQLEREKMRNKYSKGSARKAHSNTDEDHHRQLYENRLLYYLFWHRSQICKASYLSNRLYQALWNQCYHVCYVNLCKKSLCCELAVLKELKCILGGSIDFLPLKSRVMAHFSRYIQLQDPLIKLETIVSIDLTSKDLDGLLNHFCSLSSQQPPSSVKLTNYQVSLPSKFDIDQEYIERFYREEEGESEEQKLDYWWRHFQQDFEQNKRQMFNRWLIIMSAKEIYEEMLEQLFDQMYN